MSQPAFDRLCDASAVTIEYDDAADEGWYRSLFTPSSTRSLLHFSHITSLSVRYTDTWDFLNHSTPCALLRRLLEQLQHGAAMRKRKAGGGGGGEAQPALPNLTRLIVHSVPYYDDDTDTSLFEPLTTLETLTHIRLHFHRRANAQLLELLTLPHLQEVVWRQTVACVPDNIGLPSDVVEQFHSRGVTLLEQYEER